MRLSSEDMSFQVYGDGTDYTKVVSLTGIGHLASQTITRVELRTVWWPGLTVAGMMDNVVTEDFTFVRGDHKYSNLTCAPLWNIQMVRACNWLGIIQTITCKFLSSVAICKNLQNELHKRTNNHMGMSTCLILKIVKMFFNIILHHIHITLVFFITAIVGK